MLVQFLFLLLLTFSAMLQGICPYTVADTEFAKGLNCHIEDTIEGEVGTFVYKIKEEYSQQPIYQIQIEFQNEGLYQNSSFYKCGIWREEKEELIDWIYPSSGVENKSFSVYDTWASNDHSQLQKPPTYLIKCKEPFAQAYSLKIRISVERD